MRTYCYHLIETRRSSSAMAHENHTIFTSLNYMHCSTLSMMFTQEGLLKTAVPKHPSHYTFKCVRIHMRLPIIATMTNKSSATSTYKIIYQCTLHMRITGRERIKVSKPFFVHCNVTKLMAIENEHSHVENGAGPWSTEQLCTHNGGSISGLPLTIKITQDPHHHACPIEQVIQLHDILDLISLICRMRDLNGYDGSMMGCQWEYTIKQLPAEYQFLDVWDHFQLATPACNKFKEEEFLTISCKPRCSSKHVLFTPILVEMNPAMEGIHSKCNQFYSIQSFYHFWDFKLLSY